MLGVLLKFCLNIFLSEIFDKIFDIFMKTLDGNSGEISLRKILFNEISGNLSNSQVFKDCYADTIMNLEDSKSSTKFYKNVIKPFRSTFDEVILLNCRLLVVSYFSLRFNKKISVFRISEQITFKSYVYG